jgi:putative acetyltransferase
LRLTGLGKLAIGARFLHYEETMNPKYIIRNETHADVTAITEVTIAAFKTLEISNHTEQSIIEALRAAKALTVSLVAEMNGQVVGHIAFSPLSISDGTPNWFGLGPVSVLPRHQRKGIGKALIENGLEDLKKMNAKVWLHKRVRTCV